MTWVSQHIRVPLNGKTTFIFGPVHFSDNTFPSTDMASAITRRVSDRYTFAHSHIYTCELSSTATVHLHSVSDTSAEMAYDSIHFYTCIYFHCYIVTCLQGSRVWLWRLTQAHADSSYKVDSAPPQSVSPSSNDSSNWETFCYGLDYLTSGLLLYPSSLIYLYFLMHTGTLNTALS